MFGDSQTTQTLELDPERNQHNAYHGLTTINHLNINNRGGNVAARIVAYDTAEYPYQPGILSQGSSYSAPAADAQYGNSKEYTGSSTSIHNKFWLLTEVK